jgi:hypothetical protein
LTISGCFSPNFSESCVYCCWQLRELRLLLLNEAVAQDRREGVERGRIAFDAAQLLVHRLLLDPLRLRLGHRGIQVGQLLDDDVLAILERDGVVLLAIGLELRFGGLDFLALLGELAIEPVVRLLAGPRTCTRGSDRCSFSPAR